MWFQLEAVGPAWGDEAPFHFRNEVRLAAPPEVIFDLLVAPDAWPKWFPDMVSAQWVGDERGVGAQRHIVLKTQQVIEHFTVVERGVRWAFYVERSSLPLTTHFMEDYLLSPTEDGGTLLVWLVHYRPRTLLRPLHPVLRPIFAKLFRDGCTSLQAFVAAGGAVAAA